MLKKIIYRLTNRYGDKAKQVSASYSGLANKYPDVVLDIANMGFVFHTTFEPNLSKEQILINEGRRQLALEILRLCDPELPNIIYQHLNTKKKAPL